MTRTHREPTVLPDHVQVMAVPAIIDLDQVCVPEVVFNSYSAPGGIGDAILRAIRGDGGSPVWTGQDTDYRVDGGSSVAAGDLDGDDSVALVVKGDGDFLVAIDSDGTPLWRSDAFTSSSARGSAAIANLDNEGSAEIAYGRAVYDAAGVLVWEGGAGTGLNAGGPISCVADLDADGRPELIAGDTAYTFTAPWRRAISPVASLGRPRPTAMDFVKSRISPPTAHPRSSSSRRGQSRFSTHPAGRSSPTSRCPAVATAAPPTFSLSASVLNPGCLGVGPGVDVIFYEESRGLLGVTQTVSPLPAGGSERASLEVELQSGGRYQNTVAVDDDGTGSGQLNECIEDDTSEPITACGALGRARDQLASGPGFGLVGPHGCSSGAGSCTVSGVEELSDPRIESRTPSFCTRMRPPIPRTK